jgi:predicted phosphodiesterase
MKIALLADVHGNPDALGACLDAIRDLGIEQQHFLGDVVGYMPGEVECLTLLGNVDCQRGNHEAMLMGDLPAEDLHEEVYRLTAARGRLDEQALATIASWPTRRELCLDGHRVLLVHGSPLEPLTGYMYPDSDLTLYSGLGYDAIFTAHTHRPFSARLGSTTIANVGSVGLPRDAGDMAAFAVYDTEPSDCTIYRVRFDAEAVIERWGDGIHPDTRACLRRSAKRIVGEMV